MILSNEDVVAATLLSLRANLSYSYAREVVRDFRKGTDIENPALESAVQTWCNVADEVAGRLNSERRLLDFSVMTLTPDEVDTVLKRGRSDAFVLLKIESKIHDPAKVTQASERVLENSKIVDFDHTLILEHRGGLGSGIYKMKYRSSDPGANPFDTNEDYLYAIEIRKIQRPTRDDIDDISIQSLQTPETVL